MTSSIDGARRKDTDYWQDAGPPPTDQARSGRGGTAIGEMDPHTIITSRKDDLATATWAGRSALGAKNIDSAATVAATAPSKPLSSKDVLYIGMNGGESTEGAALARSTGVHMAPHDDVAKLDGRSYDLTVPAQCDAFASALVKDPARAKALSTALSGTFAKSEVAAMAILLARAESGGQVPSRIVLSGHNVGFGPQGKRLLEFETVQDVARVFPKGASLVESIHFSACSTARELDVNRAQWQSAFPGLTSMSGYDGSCPLAASGGADMISTWEKRTHGDGELMLSAGDREAKLAVWTSKHGYDSKLARDPVAQQKFLARATEAVVSSRTEGYRTGAYPSLEHAGQLEGDYRALQNAASRSDLPRELHDRLLAEATTVGAVFTFDHHGFARDKFAQAYGKEMTQALRDARLPTHDFATMTYPEALACKKELDDAVATANAPSSSLLEAQRKMGELLSLDPRRTNALLTHGTP
jgi:hypothetical protein